MAREPLEAAAPLRGRLLYVNGVPQARTELTRVVRKTLGLDFAGAAFPEEYMLGDVEVDWELPSAAAGSGAG
ncbi:hypothetical protein AB0952_23140 [Streptomyces caniferus]|uniref:hypothetical protein n=1 Tax=Streptomyces caniferus TaxID=285557 RepID=UPI003456D889